MNATPDVQLVTDTGGDLIEQAWATFDTTRTYRYALGRRWAPGPTLAAIMLNPSAADAFIMDPTARRLRSFAQREHCGAMIAVNLFALRATQPQALYHYPDPVGPGNDPVLLEHAATADIVLAAWGVHGVVHDRGAHVEHLLAAAGIPLTCLGITKDGFPRHPLYVPRTVPLVPYQPVSGVVR